MADIGLRDYLTKVEEMIEDNELQEAAAHLKHILRYFPKHVDAYRVMAQLLINRDRYLDAGDLFQRVLSVDPDDFISHIGMSLVNEDSVSIEEAIWHMERAFEVQPNVASVQERLKSLYEERTRVRPDRIRLTEGALARLYFRGQLYPQAIAECRNALKTTPNNVGLELILAQSLWLTGQDKEAARIAENVLKELPYCKVANRIVAHVSHEEKDGVHFQRLIAVDPYTEFLTPEDLTANTGQIPSNRVRLPIHEYIPGEEEEPLGQPGWADAAGVQMGAAPIDDNAPDWLRDASAALSGDVLTLPGTSRLNEITEGGEEPLPDWIAENPDAIPDWLRPTETGKLPGTGALPEWATETPDATTTPAPDWLNGDQAPTADLTPTDNDDEFLPDWLKSGDSPDSMSAAPTAEEDEDWLSDFAEDQPTPVTFAAEQPTATLADDATLDEEEDFDFDAMFGTADIPATTAMADEDDDDLDLSSLFAAADHPPGNATDDDADALAKLLAASDDDELELNALFADEETESLAIAEADAESEYDLDALFASIEEPETPATTPQPTDDELSSLFKFDAEAEADTAEDEFDLDALFASVEAPETPAAPSQPADEDDELASLLTATDNGLDIGESTIEIPDLGEEIDLPDWLTAGLDAEAETPTATITADTADEEDELTGIIASFNAPTPADDDLDLPNWLTQEDTSPEPAAASTDLPDWLTADLADDDLPEIGETTLEMDLPNESAPAETPTEDWHNVEIPDFLAEAGWVPRDPAIDLDAYSNISDDAKEDTTEHDLTAAESVTEDLAPGELAPGELPDWLSAIRPTEVEQPAKPPKPAPTGGPDWLRSAMDEETEAEAAPLLENESDLAADLVSIFGDAAHDDKTDLASLFAAETDTPLASDATETDADMDAAVDDLMSWLEGAVDDEAETEAAPPATAEASVPAWLTADEDEDDELEPAADLASLFAAETDTPLASDATETDADMDAAVGDLMSWLEGAVDDEAETEAAPPAPTEASVPAWLTADEDEDDELEPAADLASLFAAETDADMDAAVDDLMSWLEGAVDDEAETEALAEATAAPARLAPRFDDEDAATPADIMSWLEGTVANNEEPNDEPTLRVPADTGFLPDLDDENEEPLTTGSSIVTGDATDPDLDAIVGDLAGWLEQTVERVEEDELMASVKAELEQQEAEPVTPPATLARVVQEPPTTSEEDALAWLFDEDAAAVKSTPQPESEPQPPLPQTSELWPKTVAQDDAEHRPDWLADVVAEAPPTPEPPAPAPPAEPERPLSDVAAKLARAKERVRDHQRARKVNTGALSLPPESATPPEQPPAAPAPPPTPEPEPETAPAAPRAPAAIPVIKTLSKAKPDDLLDAARGTLFDDPDTALKYYGELVRRDKHIDSVIQDLEQWTPREKPASALQILGDACMKAGRLQDALHYYQQALRRI